jgi:hypothetical protein
MTKKRSGVLCGADAEKGSHYMTVKTPEKTTRFKFAVCDPCGRGLHEGAMIFFTEFVNAWKLELAKARETAKDE